MPIEVQDKWDSVYAGRIAEYRTGDLNGKSLISWKYQQYMRDYLATVLAVDENIGRLLNYLEKIGELDNTIIVYTSDQGFFLGEHGWFDKRFMYEECQRMPLIIRYPKAIKAGSTSNAISMNVDFAPTFLDFAGIEIPSDIQGASLKPVLVNEGKTPADWRKAAYYHYYEYPAEHSVKRHYGIRTQDFKLIHFYNDIDYLSADYGLTAWGDAFFWHMYKYAICLDAIPSLANSVANIIKSLYGRNKKALVLDLDNTLWGGIVGDDGVDGLAIGPEVPEGQVYAEFQSYCKALKSIGVILAVDSKNDEANALAGLNHPDGVLRPDDFVAIKANWDPKDLNLKAIASELNLGADSFVFADDNPAERAIVAAQVPGVAVPALDGAENYIKTLDHGGYFEVTALSKEDLKKTELYHQNAERAKAQAAFADYGQYLDSLEMTATIKGFEPLYIQRIAQLTNKSNQFNLTTLRCSEDDIRAMAGDKNDLCLCGKLVDKFGDNGIVTVVAGRQQGDVLDLTLWLMSCRVLKRGMEDAMMDTVVAEAAARGVKTIVGHYYPTAKNAMVREFYAQYDFAKTAEDADGNTEWTLDIAAYTPKHPHMKIER